MKAQVLTYFWAVAPIILLWILGKTKDSAAYRNVRGALGKGAFNAGAAISFAGNRYLRALYEPIESAVIDLFLFLVEQFATGVRKDNPDKMEDQIKRLQDVGSTTRLAAMTKALSKVVPLLLLALLLAPFVSKPAFAGDALMATGYPALDTLRGETYFIAQRKSNQYDTRYTSWTAMLAAQKAAAYTADTVTLAALTGYASLPSGVARLTKVYDRVWVEVPNLSGTSNAAGFTLGTVPAGYRPDTAISCMVGVTNNSLAVAGRLDIATSGVITAARDSAGVLTTVWTGTGPRPSA